MKEIILKIAKEENLYYQNNPELFDRLLLLVQKCPKAFSTVLSAKEGLYTDLAKWIKDVVPALSDPFYKISTRIYWILNGIIDFPKCRNCGSQEGMRRRNVAVTRGYPAYCCNRCQVTSTEFKTHRIATWEAKYGKGVTSPSKSAIIRERQKATCRRTYGTDYPMQSADVRVKARASKKRLYGSEYYFDIEKAKASRLAANGGVWFTAEQLAQRNQTCMNTYGVSSVMQLNAVKDRIKKTCLTKYGVDNVNKAEIIKEKKRQTFSAKYGKGIINYSQTKERAAKYIDPLYNKKINEACQTTCMQLYGTPFYTRTEEYKQKSYATRKKNGTFRSSKQEDRAFTLLKEIFPDAIRQYKDQRYPFHCDFYSPAFDFFVEFNFHWTHGGYWFNSLSNEDQEKLAKWQSKNSKFYDNAIQTWTVRDLTKRFAVEKHNLNYMVFWSEYEVEEYIVQFKSRFV